jgi:hypothetical protein
VPLPLSEDDKEVQVSFVDRRGNTTFSTTGEVKKKERGNNESEVVVFFVEVLGVELVVITPIPFEGGDDRVPLYVKRSGISRRNEQGENE